MSTEAKIKEELFKSLDKLQLTLRNKLYDECLMQLEHIMEMSKEISKDSLLLELKIILLCKLKRFKKLDVIYSESSIEIQHKLNFLYLKIQCI